MFNYFDKIHVFRKFLLSYILILIIPLLASFLIYQISVLKFKERAMDTSKSLLNQTINVIDQKNDDVEKFVYQMSLNPDVKQLMYRNSNTDKNVSYDIYKVRDSLSPYLYTSTFFRNFYIYFNQIDVIVSPESAFIRPKDYYNIHKYNALSFEDWNKSINKTYLSRYYLPATEVKMGKNKESIITYVQSIPFDSKANPKANIVMMINEKEITSFLNRISSRYAGAAFVYDDQGRIIASDHLDKNMISFNKSSGTYSIQNKKFMYIESKSNNNNWTYAAIISKEKLSEDAKFIQTISSLIAFFTIIVGIFIAILFSYKQSIPLNRLLGIMPLSETRKIKDPYDFLHSNVEEMIANNDHLKDQIQNQLPILQDSVIRKLVIGELPSSKEAMMLIDQAKLPLKGNFGYVGVVQIIHILKAMDKEMLEEMNVAQLVIQNELTDLFDGEALYCNFDVDQVVFLLSYDHKPSIQEAQKVDEALESLIKRLEEKYSLKVNIGLGRPFEQNTDIHQSYEEASISLPFIQSLDDEASVYKYEDQNPEGNIDYYYPIELELRLINAVTSGDTDEVQELFDKVYSENVEQRVLTQYIGNQLLASLNGTILRILAKNTQLNQVAVEDICNRIEELIGKKIDFKEDFKHIRGIFTEITQSIHERKFVGGQQVIYKLKEWIKQNFSDPDLTLYKIAEGVGFPEKMVPSIFKEHVGVNISDYIEDVRITFAKSKLIQTNESIEDIAEQSGYNSAHSFRRAFKRNTGSTPSEFRKMMKNVEK
ncbi:helix-turn-helix domain-containing protein [Lederbergia citrea]|uniref:helix-turn-helix domain-containing protein n=1 Tax=Lederbergia citrea TaxID=2833581 RepID=UPI001BC90C9E|nr:helix-turn-helix domain-containing protein [Lederbergia citrea]MBS4179370.1 helix-turn-helix domain-containing protein [Lederbergia citrea]